MKISPIKISAPLLALLIGTTSLGYAAPLGGNVVAGNAVIQGQGTPATTVTQSSGRVVIEWQSFDTGIPDHVNFIQPDQNALALNRITNDQPTHFMGSMTANGNIILMNQNGIIFGPQSKIDVNSIVATTTNISTDQFMQQAKPHFNLPGKSDAMIVNDGHITAAQAGLVGFVAPRVINRGLIETKLGKIHLASGDHFTLDLYGDGLVEVTASDSITSQLVANNGLLLASGGTIALTAAQAGNAVDNLIVNTGIIEATSFGTRKGVIILYGEGRNAVAKNISANKLNTKGRSTVIQAGTLNASGMAQGEKGGTVKVLGDHIALINPSVISAMGDAGGGTIHIGGDYLGSGDTPTAQSVFVAPEAYIFNQAINHGNGGQTIVWSDDTTEFYGTIIGTGGKLSGNGGFTETSGKKNLIAQGLVDLTAAHGDKGRYLLDPDTITIYGNVDPTFVSTDHTMDLGGSLQTWLDGSDPSKVMLTYTNFGHTVTGTQGTNTLIANSMLDDYLVPGARIRLSSGGAITAADIMGPDTYTVASVSGNILTLTTNLSQNYSVATDLYLGQVSQWNDKSGLANDATQSDPSRMPIWRDNVLNNRDTLYFGNDDGMFINDNLNLTNTGYSIFTLFSRDRNGNSSGIYGRALNGRDNNWLVGPWQNNLSQYSGTGFVTLDNLNWGQHYLTASINDMTQSAFYADGLDITGDPSHIGQPGRLGIGTVGMYYEENMGDIPEIIVYNNAFNTEARNLIEQYQSVKWGIPLAAPGTGATEVDRAMSATGYNVFTTDYLEHLSASADIILQADHGITLDLQGDGLTLSAGRSLSLTTIDGDITSLSTGTITTTRNAGSNGNITMTAGGTGLIDLTGLALSATNGDVTLNAGGAITLDRVYAGTITAQSASGTDITLNDTLTSTRSGNSLVLASGRHFINHAGAGSISAGAGRYLVYSNDPTHNIRGVNSGFQNIYNVTYAGYAPGMVTQPGNLFLYSVSAPPSPPIPPPASSSQNIPTTFETPKYILGPINVQTILTDNIFSDNDGVIQTNHLDSTQNSLNNKRKAVTNEMFRKKDGKIAMDKTNCLYTVIGYGKDIRLTGDCR